MSWIGVITNAGAALLAQWAGGSETLYITGATVGSGYVAEANMRTATALQSTKDNGSIVENKAAGTTGRRIRIRVGPHATTAYIAHEIGVWAKLGENGTPTLLSLHQDASEGISVPTVATSPEFVFDLNAVLTVSNNGSLSVSIDTTVYVSNLQFEQEKAINRLMAESIPNCEAVPTYNGDGDVTQITHTDVDSEEVMRTDVITYGTGTITEVRTLASGEVLTITMTIATDKTTYIFS